MDPTVPISGRIGAASFSFLSADEIRAISVKPVTNPVLFDGANLPTDGGLYDPCFGPLDRASMYALIFSCLLLDICVDTLFITFQLQNMFALLL